MNYAPQPEEESLSGREARTDPSASLLPEVAPGGTVPKPSPDFERAMDLIGRGKGLVLFDGECAFCNATVRFILRNERREQFYFAPLQSELGRELAARFVKESPVPDSLILIQEGKAHLRSDGALMIGSQLRFPWNRGAGISAWVPRIVRDAVYNFIAKNRIGWFGATESCVLPTSEQRARLLAE